MWITLQSTQTKYGSPPSLWDYGSHPTLDSKASMLDWWLRRPRYKLYLKTWFLKYFREKPFEMLDPHLLQDCSSDYQRANDATNYWGKARFFFNFCHGNISSVKRSRRLIGTQTRPSHTRPSHTRPSHTRPSHTLPSHRENFVFYNAWCEILSLL